MSEPNELPPHHSAPSSSTRINALPGTQTNDGTQPTVPDDGGRLAYSQASDRLGKLQEYAAKTGQDMSAEIAAAEAIENDLAIKSGLRAPPPKFEEPKYEPAPRDGWFKPQFADQEGEGHPAIAASRADILANHRSQGRHDLANAIEKDWERQRSESLKTRHRNWHLGKAIVEERGRCMEQLRDNPYYFGPDPEAGMQRHLTAYSKTVKIPPYAEPTWLEKAPAGSVAPEVITTADLAGMSSEMRSAFMHASKGQTPVDTMGRPVKGALGPFRLASRAKPSATPFAAGSRVHVSRVTAEHVKTMSPADRRAFLRASNLAASGGSPSSVPTVEGATIEFVW